MVRGPRLTAGGFYAFYSFMLKKLTIMENDSKASEHAKAKWWRQRVMGMDIPALAEATGYSSRVVYLMENGVNSLGRKVKPWVWQRYKLCCAAVAAQAGRFGNTSQRQHNFDWS